MVGASLTPACYQPTKPPSLARRRLCYKTPVVLRQGSSDFLFGIGVALIGFLRLAREAHGIGAEAFVERRYDISLDDVAPEGRLIQGRINLIFDGVVGRFGFAPVHVGVHVVYRVVPIVEEQPIEGADVGAGDVAGVVILRLLISMDMLYKVENDNHVE